MSLGKKQRNCPKVNKNYHSSWWEPSLRSFGNGSKVYVVKVPSLEKNTQQRREGSSFNSFKKLKNPHNSPFLPWTVLIRKHTRTKNYMMSMESSLWFLRLDLLNNKTALAPNLWNAIKKLLSDIHTQIKFEDGGSVHKFFLYISWLLRIPGQNFYHNQDIKLCMLWLKSPLGHIWYHLDHFMRPSALPRAHK